MAKRRLCACGVPRKRTYKRRKSLANVPISKYHHKTEMPGAVGHHKLHGLGAVKKCITWLNAAGTRMRSCKNSKGQYRITGKA